MVLSRSSSPLVVKVTRQCLACDHRFTTYEEVEHGALVVLKRDDRREEFSKEKLLSGIKKACQKRPISPKLIEDMVDRISDEVLRGSVVTVDAPAPLPIELDGEQPGTTPVRFELVPRAMRVRVPR